MSRLQRFEFLVFLVPLSFFLLAFLVLAMTLLPAPGHSPGLRAARASRAVLSASSGPSRSATVILCGHAMHGVSSAAWSQYCVGAGGWLCVHSREQLDSANVNDDYCDCADGSDEPGTSACAGRETSDVRFTCRTQRMNATVPLSAVNDGVCDCCDGYTGSAQHTPRANKHAATIDSSARSAHCSIVLLCACVRVGRCVAQKR